MAVSATVKVSNKTVLRYLWKHACRYPALLACNILIVLAVGGSTLAPIFLKQVIDGLASHTPSTAAAEALAPVLLLLFLAWGANWLGWRLSGWVGASMFARTMKDLEVAGFTYLLGHAYQFFSDSFTGSLVRRVRRISRAFEDLFDEVQFRFTPAVVILTGALVGLALNSYVLALIFGAWCVLFIILNIIASQWKLKLDIRRSELDSEVTGALSDAITNAVTIKLFANAHGEVGRFSRVAESYRAIQTRSWQRGEIIFAIQGVFMLAVNITLMIVGVQLWSRGELTVGGLVLIQTYLLMVFDTLWDIGRSFRKVYESLADAKEMVEILETPYGVRDKRGAKMLAVKKGVIEFRKVTFAFHGTREVLKNFSLSIKSGEKIALVGPSGAGKSTITKLLYRFYDVDAGKILIDGQDIASVTQESLRRHIALVPQEPILFHRSLRENILYGRPDASEAEMLDASKKAHCHEFISQLPDGYESFVGERGVKLSGGERQRVAIARAILTNAPILILDEATSSLDSESEHYIKEALHELMQHKTVIVIAHRLSTIMEMDRIAVIEHGQVTATGTHEELLQQTGTYKRLWDIQAGGFITEEEDEELE